MLALIILLRISVTLNLKWVPYYITLSAHYFSDLREGRAASVKRIEKQKPKWSKAFYEKRHQEKQLATIILSVTLCIGGLESNHEIVTLVTRLKDRKNNRFYEPISLRTPSLLEKGKQYR